MMAEYGSSLKNDKSGIYSWMERSVGAKFVFTGFIMWYASYLIGMVNTSNGIWLSFTTLLTGYDATMHLELEF